MGMELNKTPVPDFFYYKLGGLIFRSDIRLAGIKETPFSAVYDVNISLAEMIKPDNLAKVKKLNRLGISPLKAGNQDGFYLDWGIYGLFYIGKGSEIYYDTCAKNSMYFVHLLVNEVFGGIFFQRGCFLLHGSAAILRDNSAVVVVGEPGAGKSTSLGMLYKNGCEILTDELVIIDFTDEGLPFVIPYLPVLRLWTESALYLNYTNDDLSSGKHEIYIDSKTESPVLVDSIVSLKKGEDFTTFKVPESAEFFELLGHFPLPDTLMNLEQQSRRFLQASSIIKKCRLYKVIRNDDSFVKMEEFLNETFLKPQSTIES